MKLTFAILERIQYFYWGVHYGIKWKLTQAGLRGDRLFLEELRNFWKPHRAQ